MRWMAEACGNTFLVLSSEDQGTAYLQQRRERNQWSFDSALIVDFDSHTMRVIERDGSESVMCGNGARAVGCLFDRVGVSRHLRAGSMDAFIERRRHGYVVPMPSPTLTAITSATQQLPELWWYEVAGEPHAVALVQSLSEAQIISWGRQIVPVANCTVVQRNGLRGIAARTYERGVNRITQSCGTGACAATQRAIHAGWMPTRTSVRVLMHQHELFVHSDGDGLLLQGAAAVREESFE